MRNNYKHKVTGKIARYVPMLEVWYVEGLGYSMEAWQFEKSNDWEEIIPPTNDDEPLYSINDIKKAMDQISYSPGIITMKATILKYLRQLKQNGI